MTDYSIFPKINATLNGCSGVLLVTGRVLIARGQRAAHRAVMLTALGTSTLFLASYLYYHAHVGSVHFRGTGWPRPVYFTILISHTILAAAIVPMVVITLNHALRGRFDKHRAIARWQRDEALRRTAASRPDLIRRLAAAADGLDKRDRQVLADVGFPVNAEDMAH